MALKEKSVSLTLDTGSTKGCLAHNSRDTRPPHVDAERTHLNRILLARSLEDAYEALFRRTIDEYMELKKKRDKDRLFDYLAYMNSGKRKAFRELIVMIGNKFDTSADSEDGKRAADALVAYFNEFLSHNPQLYVIGAYLHMDEATPHLHIDFIPWGEGYSYWLVRRVSFARALKMQGFDAGTRGYTSYMQWLDSEKQALGEVMERFGFEWVDLGTHDTHRNIHEYKLEKAEQELERLELMKADLKEDIVCLMDGQADIRIVEKYRGELMNKLERDPEYQLEEPSGFMTAKKYVATFAAPLYERFRKLLRDLVERLLKAKAALALVVNERNELENKVRDLKREKNILTYQFEKEKQRSKDLSLLKKAIGYDEADRLLEKIKKTEKGTKVKTHDYYQLDR